MANINTVLVIDDSPTVRRLAEAVLSQEGYTVFTAEDGDDGLKIAREEIPSVIIVDFIMPKMNGYQLCKNIRSDSTLNNIPIVLITSKGEEVGKGFDEKFGLIRYLKKPFEAKTLTKIVGEALEVGEAEPATGSEDVAAEEIPVTDTGAESGTATPEDLLPMDIPFVEINSTTPMQGEYHIEETHPEDVYLINTPDAELPSTEDSPPESSSMVEDDTAPAEPETATPEDLLPADIPFVEINSTAIMHEEYHTEETHPEDVSLINTPDTELPSTEDSPPESSSMVEADTAPANAPSMEDKPVAPIYAAIQENIGKEFRHYFGRELTVLLKNTMIQALKETDLVRSSRRILSGDMMYISVTDVLQLISASGLSGKLTVSTNNFNSEIYLENGRIAFASISRPDYGTCLEELILNEEKFRSREEILSAFSEASGNSIKAGGILIDRGLITEAELTDYYRRLSEDAVHQTLSSTSGHFYIEDVPLPVEIRSVNLTIPLTGARR